MNDQTALIISLMVTFVSLLLVTMQALKSDRGNPTTLVLLGVMFWSYGNAVGQLARMQEYAYVVLLVVLVLAALLNLRFMHVKPPQATSKTTSPKSGDAQASA
jgi:hypothetical protein